MKNNGNNKVKLRHQLDMRDSSRRLRQILRSVKKYTIRNEDLCNLESVRKLRAMCLRKEHTALFVTRYSVAIFLGIATIIMVLLVYCNRIQTTSNCNSNTSQDTSVQTVRPRYLHHVPSGNGEKLCSRDDLDDRVVDYPVVTSSSRLLLQRKR